MNNADISFYAQVAYKGVIELIKADKVSLDDTSIKEYVVKHTGIIIDTVKEYTEPKPIGASHKHELKQLVESSILDEEQEAAAYRAIEDVKSMKGYEELKTKLLNHQRESNNPSAKEIGEKVEEKADRKNS